MPACTLFSPSAKASCPARSKACRSHSAVSWQSGAPYLRVVRVCRASFVQTSVDGRSGKGHVKDACMHARGLECSASLQLSSGTVPRQERPVLDLLTASSSTPIPSLLHGYSLVLATETLDMLLLRVPSKLRDYITTGPARRGGRQCTIHEQAEC